MHKDFVYFWIENKGMKTIEPMSSTKSTLFDRIDDEHVYIGRVKEDEQKLEWWQYMQISICLNDFKFEPAFQMN